MDVVYQYDGTLEGFLCCVYDSYVYKESPVGFSADEGFLSLYEVRTVATDREHGKRVYQGLVKRSAKAANVLRRAFLTCMEDKELCFRREAASCGICPIRYATRCTGPSAT